MGIPDIGQTLWHVRFGCHQTIMPDKEYWWDNALRNPPGIVYVQIGLSGRIRWRDAHGERWIQPGTAMLFAHGDATAYGRQPHETDEPYRCDWVELGGAGLAEHWRVLQDRHGCLVHAGIAGPLHVALGHLLDLARPDVHAGMLAQSEAVHSFVAILISGLEQQRAAHRSPVERAVDALLSEPLLVKNLARHARRHGVSREHLVRVFGKRTGESPSTFLARHHLQRALRLLRDTNLSLMEVARHSGYPSLRALMRGIRRETGETPGAWRRRFVTIER